MSSSKGPPSRRTAKSLSASQQRAVEEKRLRGELSCAECRRLKLRCDRLIPCSSCTRRGCGSICPSGILDPGSVHVHQGGMRIGQLRTKISIMAGRIRELEAALSQGHALLEERLLRIGRIDEEIPPEEPASVSLADGLGTLTLGENGEASYFGSSGGNESLFAREMMYHPDEDDGEDSDESSPSVTPELFTAIAGPVTDEPFALPPEHEAQKLATLYCERGAVFFRAWRREELETDILPKAYAPGGAPAHLQSALFFAFALATYLDPKLLNGLHEAQAENWFRLGRVAFQSKSRKRNSPEDTIRALCLMGTYFSMASRHHSRDSAWTAFALAAKLCQAAGLHRDPARWNLPPALVQRRRSLFWEVYQADVSHSLALGRPPTTPLSFVDCEFPEDDPSGEDIHNVKYRYSRDAFIPIMDLALAAHPSKRPYRDVLELDAKIRRLQVPIKSSDNALKVFYASQLLNAVILTLHRTYMARGILNGNETAAQDSNSNKPFDPFDSAQTPYAPSVNAAYHASQEISRGLHGFCSIEPETAGRVWFLNYHGFSAALVLGALVSRAPGTSYAPSALMTLGLVVDGVFGKYVDLSPRHKTAFVLLRRLKTRAIRRYTAFLETKATAGDEDNKEAGSKEAGDAALSEGPSISRGGKIGLGPGAIDPNDPLLHLKMDSDPETDSEDNNQHKISKGSIGTGVSDKAAEELATFASKIAMFGGGTSVVLNAKGKKKSKKKRKETAEGVSASASPESAANSPESTTSHDTSVSVPEDGSISKQQLFSDMAPSSSTMTTTSYNSLQDMPNNANITPNDIFMSEFDMKELGIDSTLDGMEGIENFNVDAFGFGYDNFGTDAGSGIVMGMALEDIGLGANTGSGGFPNDSSSSITPTFNAGKGSQSQKGGRTENLFDTFQQPYNFTPQSSLSPRTSSSPSASPSQTQQVQEPEEDKSEPLTATAQAARMFDMGMFSETDSFLIANNMSTGSAPTNRGSEYSLLSWYTKQLGQNQQAPAQALPQPPPPLPQNPTQIFHQFWEQQSTGPAPSHTSPSTTTSNSASTGSPASYPLPQSQAQSPVSSPTTTASPSAGLFTDDPTQLLFARFKEFMVQRAQEQRQQLQQQSQNRMVNSMSQQQLQQNQQAYAVTNGSYNPNFGGGASNGYTLSSPVNSRPNPNSSANALTSGLEYNEEIDAFFKTLGVPGLEAETRTGMGPAAGSGGYVLPYGQMYPNEWQHLSHSGAGAP